MQRASIAVFDVGNVLIRWDPRNLYRRLFSDEAAMEHFLATVCTPAWNVEQDRGRTFKQAVAELSAQHPDKAELIAAYDLRWQDMVPGPVEGTADILAELQADGVRTFAITNFSAEKFAESQQRFPFLASFEGVVVSAHERLIKPDPAIYRVLLTRHGLAAEDCVFIDDSHENVLAARGVGMQAVHFVDAQSLRPALAEAGLPVRALAG
jgi:2-haloacid dehalogenase